MFFIKQVISFFFNPLVWVFILALMAWIFVKQRKKRHAKTFFSLSFFMLFLISYQPIATILIKSLENDYPRLETIPANVKYILALGGDSKGRSYEVLRLYQMQKNIKIIASGHHANVNGGANYTAKLLIASGIAKEAISINARSRDTKEEMQMMKKLVGKGAFILVTAAYHMPRSMALFQKAGLHPIAAPTNFLGSKAKFSSIFRSRTISVLEIALHEYIGFIWYKLKGLI